MLARIYNKKKAKQQRALMLPYDPHAAAANTSDGGEHEHDGDDGGDSDPDGRGAGHAASHPPPSSSSSSSKFWSLRRRRPKTGRHEDRRSVPSPMSKSKHYLHGDDGYERGDSGDEYEDDDDDEEEDFEDGDDELSPVDHRPRRRFVRSGMTTYEQWISRNAVGRRFNRPSFPTTSNMTERGTSAAARAPSYDGSATTASLAETSSTASPPESVTGGSTRWTSHYGNHGGDGGKRSVSSLSSALNEVLHSRPTALQSVVEPNTNRSQGIRTFVVEQTPEGEMFVASMRIPDKRGDVTNRPRHVQDDSFIGLRTEDGDNDMVSALPMASSGPAASSHGQHAAMRHSDMDFMARKPWGAPLSAAERTGMAPFPTQARAPRPSLLNYRNQGNGLTPRTARTDSVVIMGDEPSAVVPLLDDGDRSRMNSLVPPEEEQGRMSLSDLMGSPVGPPVESKTNTVASGATAEEEEEEEDDEDESVFTNSFRGVRDVDLLVRMKSSDDIKEHDEDADDEKEGGDAEEEPASTDDDEGGYEDYHDPAVRASDNIVTGYTSYSNINRSNHFGAPNGSGNNHYNNNNNVSNGNNGNGGGNNTNITAFLGGFKSRNSMNRSSLGSRGSIGARAPTAPPNMFGRKDDFASRAARSLRNSRKAAPPPTSSELSRRLREARARVPLDLRDDPPKKKRGFLSNSSSKHVRFDMSLYCREFEVEEPMDSDDEENISSRSKLDHEHNGHNEEDGPSGDGHGEVTNENTNLAANVRSSVVPLGGHEGLFDRPSSRRGASGR